jgi:hypothetical protein
MFLINSNVKKTMGWHTDRLELINVRVTFALILVVIQGKLWFFIIIIIFYFILSLMLSVVKNSSWLKFEQ